CNAGTCAACVVDLGLGRLHACMLVHDGTIWCSGANDRGQLGNGAIGANTATPVQVIDASGPVRDAVAVAGGTAHSCAIRAGGAVWCWGGAYSGQLGNGGLVDSPLAVPVSTGTGALSGIVELGLQRDVSCARGGAG